MRAFRTPHVILVMAIAATLLPGCDDAATSPSALLVGGEAKAALQVAQRLPTLPSLATRAMVERAASGRSATTLLEARALWLDAEAASPAAAVRMRDEAYAMAVPELANAFGEADLRAVQDSLSQWIRIASNANGIGDISGIAWALDEASRLLEAAGRAEPLDHARAVELTLRASDRLASTTPRAVATQMTAEAERRWAELTSASPPVSFRLEGARRERADRLVRGAMASLAKGDYLLAIRRAYYAKQLLSPTTESDSER